MSWTDERVEQLRKMWLDGLSASQIASELGEGVTRNAVIGKVHRLGLSGRVKSATPAPALRSRSQDAGQDVSQNLDHELELESVHEPVAARSEEILRRAEPMIVASAPIVQGALAVAVAPTTLAAAPERAPAPRPASKDVVIPLSERVSIMDLRESMCRWPLGDPTSPDFRYCGAKMQIGLGPYCSTHARIAYQPAQDRRRERQMARG